MTRWQNVLNHNAYSHHEMVPTSLAVIFSVGVAVKLETLNCHFTQIK